MTGLDFIRKQLETFKVVLVALKSDGQKVDNLSINKGTDAKHHHLSIHLTVAKQT